MNVSKRKINKFLLFRLISGLMFIIISFTPLLFFPLKWSFRWTMPFFVSLYLRACKIRVHNLTGFDVNEKCPAVFASNHKCFADPIIIAKPIKRLFTFTMSQHVLDMVKSFRIIAWKLKFVTLDKNNYNSYIKAFEKIKDLKNQGYSLLFFPEGYYTLDKPVGTMKSGIYKIAKETDSLIIPVAIYGINQDFSYESKLKWKDVYIKYGQPMKKSDFSGKPAFMKELTHRIETLYYEIENKVSSK